MKKKMCVILLFILVSFLYSSLGQFENLQCKYEKGIELLLSRLDYGTSRAFLPSNLAFAIGANEIFPLQEDVYMWDMDLEEWDMLYQFVFTFADEYVSQMVMNISYQGMEYQIITDFIWAGGFLTETDVSIFMMEVTSPSKHEYFYYTEGGLFDSYLQTGWEAENEIWIDLEQINTTIVDGKITVIATDEYNYDVMAWVPDERRTYTWDGELITSQMQEYFDGYNWDNEDMNYMIYHDSGQMNYVLYQTWQDGGWVDDYKTTYTYEDNLNTYSLNEVWEEGVWVNDHETYFTYDDQERLVMGHENDFYEGGWINQQESYIYYTLDNDPDEIEPVSQNMMLYPNPFNPSTTLSWQVNGSILPDLLAIYDIKGRKIDQIDVSTGVDGKGSVSWNGKDAPSGVYFFRLSGYESCSKGILLK